MKQKTCRGEYVSPLMQFNRELENRLALPQLTERAGTPFCRYNDELVGRIEFEIVNRNNIRLEHNDSSAVQLIGLRPDF